MATAAEDWLRAHYREPQAVAGMMEECGVPKRGLKRRFVTANAVRVRLDSQQE